MYYLRLTCAVNLLRHQIKILKSGVADCIDDCHKFTNFYLLICAYLYGLFFINLPQAGEFRFQTSFPFRRLTPSGVTVRIISVSDCCFADEDVGSSTEMASSGEK